MPRSLDPSQPLVLVLASDVDKPKEVQPRFLAKHMDTQKKIQFLKCVENVQAAGRSENPVASEKLSAIYDNAVAAVAVCISGWENITHPETGHPLSYSVDALKMILDIDELMEIVGFMTGTFKLTVDDKKKSELLH